MRRSAAETWNLVRENSRSVKFNSRDLTEGRETQENGSLTRNSGLSVEHRDGSDGESGGIETGASVELKNKDACCQAPNLVVMGLER